MPGKNRFSGDTPDSFKKGKPSSQDKLPHGALEDDEEAQGRELRGRVYGMNDDALAQEIAQHLETTLIDKHNPGETMFALVPGGEKGNSFAPFEHRAEAVSGLPAQGPHGRPRGNQDKTGAGVKQSTKKN